jgi:hypothetical protein
MLIPEFCTLDQLDLELFSMLGLPTDVYPSFVNTALQDDLMSALLFAQSIPLIEYNLESFPDTTTIPPVLHQVTVEDLPFQARELTGPVRRSKHTNPRRFHACDHCIYRNTKVSMRSHHHIFLRSLTIVLSVLGSSQCARAAGKGERPAPGLLRLQNP